MGIPFFKKLFSRNFRLKKTTMPFSKKFFWEKFAYKKKTSYICPMRKTLFILAVLFTTMSYSQNKLGQFFYGYKTQHFKVTIKTMLNSNVMDQLSAQDYSQVDVVNVGAYDVRLKVYLTKRVSLVNRMVATGLNTKTYYYSSGLVFKF